METFLRRHDDLTPATRRKLLQHLDNPNEKANQELELVVIVDAGMPFVQATYKLEGDATLVLEYYEVISSLSTAVKIVPMPHYPNLQAVARRLSGGKKQIRNNRLLPVYSLAYSTIINVFVKA